MAAIPAAHVPPYPGGRVARPMSMERSGGGSAPGDVQLAVTNVSKRFGGVRAVEDVSIMVRRGEIASVIGPNGAGKTSLLNMISGFYKPDTGSIVFDGHDITRAKPSEIAARGIA